MSDELIRKSEALELIDSLRHADPEICNVFAWSAALMEVGQGIEELPPVNAVELPCKIGDEVFEPILKSGTIYSRTVEGFTVSDQIELINCETKNFYWCEIGDNVFLTREEAEKALEDLKNG